MRLGDIARIDNGTPDGVRIEHWRVALQHGMIAAFGGPEIPLADYATYGSPELSENVLKAMAGHSGCLMANHGMVVAGDNLGRAMWLANELEALAHQHYHTLLLGGAAILTQDELDDTLKSFASYGKKSRGDAT